MNEDIKIIAQDLGLTASATILDIRNAMFEQKKQITAVQEENKTLKAKVQGFEAKAKEAETTEADTLIEAAVTDGKITIEQKPIWKENFQANHDASKRLLATMGKVVKLSDVPKTEANGGTTTNAAGTYQGKTFSQLSKDNPNLLANLKEKDPATFNQLYKAEFGKDWLVEPKATAIG
jgi:hypothetical protein